MKNRIQNFLLLLLSSPSKHFFRSVVFLYLRILAVNQICEICFFVCKISVLQKKKTLLDEKYFSCCSYTDILSKFLRKLFHLYLG